ncbi:MAG: multiple sugar transport system permease protein [Mycobacteriales bacterium]
MTTVHIGQLSDPVGAAGPAGAAGVVTPPRSARQRAGRFGLYLALAALAALFFVPFGWSLITSLKTLPDSVRFSFWPQHPTLAGYRDALTTFNFGRYALNSAIVASVITACNVVLAALGGYAFARLRFPGRDLLFLLVLASLMIPDQLRLVPVYQMVSALGLVSTYQGYILIKLVEATNLFFMRQYFLSLPRDLEEAAKLDNAGYFKTFWKVMLPLAGPAIASVVILEFQGIWNEFFWPLLILQDQSKWTLPIGIAQFTFAYQTNWPPLMAASVIAILPVLLLFVLLQRYFIAGATAAAVKQ